jgi:DNA repair protein RecO (recombination protein O)
MVFLEFKDEYYKIVECEIFCSFPKIREDSKKLFIAYKLFKLINEFISYPQRDSDLFNTLLDSLKYLEKFPNELVYYWFLLKLLKSLGFEPNLSKCSKCNKNDNISYFSNYIGGVLCKTCARNNQSIIYIGKDLYNLLKFLQQLKDIKALPELTDSKMLKNLSGFFKNYIKYIKE